MSRAPLIAAFVLLGTVASVGACAEGAQTPEAEPEIPTGTGGKDAGKSSSSSSGDSTKLPPSSGEDEDDASTSSSSSSSSGSSSSSSGGSSSSSSGGSSSSSSGSTSSSSGSTGTPDAGKDGGDAGDAGEGGACTLVPPSNACGLAPQCGCANNQTCEVTNKTTGAVSCILAGGGPQASLCTTSAQCAAGLTCAYGACRPYCATAGASCGGLSKCGQYYEPPGTAVPNSKVCTIPCSLTSPSTQCGSNTCIWDTSLKASDCDKAGTKNEYDSCASYNDCKPGLACMNHPFFGYECERWCRVGHDEECGLFESCEDVYGANAPFQGTDKLGHCQ